MGEIPKETIDRVCDYLRSKFDGCETVDESLSRSDTVEFEIAWQGSKKLVAITEEFFSSHDDVQTIHQSLEGLALPEHLEVLDGIKVVWKEGHALLEEYD